MAGNSFPTHDGGHVVGAVAMALDDQGQAVPVGEDTPIGTVRVEGLALDQFMRALAGHAAFVTGKDPEDAHRFISAFVTKASRS